MEHDKHKQVEIWLAKKSTVTYSDGSSTTKNNCGEQPYCHINTTPHGLRRPAWTLTTNRSKYHQFHSCVFLTCCDGRTWVLAAQEQTTRLKAGWGSQNWLWTWRWTGLVCQGENWAPCLWERERDKKLGEWKYDLGFLICCLSDSQADRRTDCTLCEPAADLHGAIPLAVLAG